MTITTTETEAALDACRVRLTSREAQLEELERRRIAVREVAASDPTPQNRDVFAAVKAEIRHVEDELELEEEAVKLATRAHEAAVRAEKKAKFDDLVRLADPAFTFRRLRDEYVAVLMDAARTLENALVKKDAIVAVQRRWHAEAQELAAELGIACPGFKIDAEAVRVLGNRLQTTETDLGRLLTPVHDAFYWDGGYKRQHWLTTPDQFDLAGRYMGWLREIREAEEKESATAESAEPTAATEETTNEQA